jgi:hypothetical protein
MNVSFEGNTSTGKDEWLTPVELVKSIAEFDLDPCQPVNPPFTHAKKGYNINDDGLKQKWEGLVFCNPPYGKQTEKWLMRCADHGDAIALVFARTETKSFFSQVWNKAYAVFFLKGRISFYHVSGEKADSAGAPSVLIAYNRNTANILQKTTLQGKFILLK